MPLFRRRMPMLRVRRFRGRRRRSTRRRGMKKMEVNYIDHRSTVTDKSSHVNLIDIDNDTTLAYSNNVSNLPKWVLWQEQSSTNQTIYLAVSGIEQGTSTNTRIGKRVLIKKAMFDLNIQLQAATAENPSSDAPNLPDSIEVHFALVRHRAASGSLPVNEHIYEYSRTGSAGRPTIFRQKNYTSQYEVIKTWYKNLKLDVEWNGISTQRVAEAVRNVKKTVAVNKYCIYKSNLSAGTPTAHQDGGLYLMTWSNLLTDKFTIHVNGMCRVTFIDV